MAAIITPDTKITDKEYWTCVVEQMTGSPRMGTAKWNEVTSLEHAGSIAASMLSCDVEPDGIGGTLLVTHPDVSLLVAGRLDRDGLCVFQWGSFRITIEAP